MVSPVSTEGRRDHRQEEVAEGPSCRLISKSSTAVQCHRPTAPRYRHRITLTKLLLQEPLEPVGLVLGKKFVGRPASPAKTIRPQPWSGSDEDGAALFEVDVVEVGGRHTFRNASGNKGALGQHAHKQFSIVSQRGLILLCPIGCLDLLWR